jgi:hypothetical protein
MKKILFTLFFLLTTTLVMGQGLVYSYADPCTSKTKELYIPNPSQSVVLSYNGSVQSFTYAQLQSGAMEQWINEVNSQNPLGPCSGVGLQLNTSINATIAANNIQVLTTVLTSISSLSGGANIEGVIQADEKVSSNNKNNPLISGNQTTEQNSGNQGNNGVSSSNPVTSSNNTTPNTNNSTTPNTNNSTGSNQNTSQGGATDITGGINSVKLDNTEKSDKEGLGDAQSSSAGSSSSTKSKVAAVKKGSIMMTGDIVVIGSAAGSDPSQIRVNTSIISSNTKNTFAKGALVNYTSQINNTNITLFASYRYKKSTTILANSSMMNFDKDFFNTTSIMESYQIKKVTATLGVNYTVGNLGESKFQSLSTLAGVYSSFNVNKKMGMTTMFVMVYSPYVFYYEGMWNQSGFLAVPFLAVDYKLTKKFKLNISFSGVQQIKDQPLNYQVLLGAKAFL